MKVIFFIAVLGTPTHEALFPAHLFRPAYYRRQQRQQGANLHARYWRWHAKWR
jgi:hypothetical protein